MPSLSKLFKSAKQTFSNRRNSKSSSNEGTKSVRFSMSDESYYTHSSVEYDRRSSIALDPYRHEGDSLKSFNSDLEQEQEQEQDSALFDEEVRRNTRVNKKQGHYSIAALVAYRANI